LKTSVPSGIIEDSAAALAAVLLKTCKAPSPSSQRTANAYWRPSPPFAGSYHVLRWPIASEVRKNQPKNVRGLLSAVEDFHPSPRGATLVASLRLQPRAHLLSRACSDSRLVAKWRADLLHTRSAALGRFPFYH